jgi:type I restriction-modification system DNA methylase subunit
MALSWREIKERAIAFSKEWEDTCNEDADAKSFLDAFFNVFGVPRRRVATFEERVKKIDNRDGYIDMLWKGTILVEMKSRGRDLDKAYTQAKDYFPGLKEHELPKYILVCDFLNFRLFDLDSGEVAEFTLGEFYKNVKLFGFIAGYSTTTEYKEQDPVNIRAAELMATLHDRLKSVGYEGHDLEVYLVRLLFCLFADDTTIFNKNTFYDYLSRHTAEGGDDLASVMSEIFETLNTPEERRLKNIPEDLAAFPYVNGKLFEERLRLAHFDGKMRDILLTCCTLDWGKISPAIFGSMFQSVMNPAERRNLGAHYTSERNILKLIRPLFLDELWREFEKSRHSEGQLKKFHAKISSLKFLDPACGCGNFLVVTYRELRLLELEVLKAIRKAQGLENQQVTNIEQAVLCNVDQFYGIEYEEFPAQIAQVALWLVDHQMNMRVSEEFGNYFVRLPLRKSATIVHGDALETAWERIVSPAELSYILGNPPFVGSKLMTQFQRDQVVREFGSARGAGVMDYVSAWYVRAAKYIQGTNIRVAFVSTNSIVQGEQVGILWGLMLNRYGIKIHFAHRTFKWSNEARGRAAVYCVIIGFAAFDTADKRIFEYEDIRGEADEVHARNINPYLVDAPDVIIQSRSNPLCSVPKIKFGNQPIDGGFLLLDETEHYKAIQNDPAVSKWIRKYVGSVEFLNNIPRFCLWLNGADPRELRSHSFIVERLRKVKEFRESSERKATRELAATPTQFAFVSHNESEYIIVPSVSSERRKYIPIGFMSPDIIASNLCLIIPNGTLYHFGVLTSVMHMAWVKYVCGRLKSDYRYSAGIVYNNYPWPQSPSDKHIAAIEAAAQRVLDARAEFPDSSLADLYDPLAMPPALVKAHTALDRAVDAAYRSVPFPTEGSRMEFLFALYGKYNAELFTVRKKKKREI